MNLMLESVIGQIRDSVVAEISALGIEKGIKIKKRNVQSSCHFDVYLHEAEAPAVGEIGQGFDQVGFEIPCFYFCYYKEFQIEKEKYFRTAESSK